MRTVHVGGLRSLTGALILSRLCTKGHFHKNTRRFVEDMQSTEVQDVSKRCIIRDFRAEYYRERIPSRRPSLFKRRANVPCSKHGGIFRHARRASDIDTYSIGM